jgi:threonine dehydratase
MSIALSDIQAAAARLEGQAVRTPLIESPALNERLGGRMLIKPETLQRAGPSSSAAPTTACPS